MKKLIVFYAIGFIIFVLVHFMLTSEKLYLSFLTGLGGTAITFLFNEIRGFNKKLLN